MYSKKAIRSKVTNMNAGRKEVCLTDAYPGKAQYRPGELIEILFEITNTCGHFHGYAVIEVLNLNECIYREKVDVCVNPKTTEKFCLSIQTSFDETCRGYGVDIGLFDASGLTDSISTAFDIAEHWFMAPRYGFLSDFYIDDETDEGDIRQLEKYHINVVQYYDWMYRHETLTPPGDYFRDPLGRDLSLLAVRNKINASRKLGMYNVAYGAIYGASRDFYKEHENWALYNNKGDAEGFDDWLYIMNISPESPWSAHIVEEYAECMEKIGFDGIHMDTYGFPKTAYSRLNGEKKLERLEEQFPLLINKTRDRIKKVKEDSCLIFNAVNNWPVDKVACAGQDIIYIEVWPPNDKYIHLYQLIKRAREAGDKQVVLAAYLKPFKEEGKIGLKQLESCFVLASAAIYASGGYHLLLGENNQILSDSYYVKHSNIPESLIRTFRNYYDFIVRYENLLFDLSLSDISMTFANGINEEILFENGNYSSYAEPDKIWTIVKEKPGLLVINLINLTGIKSDNWNEPKENLPSAVRGIRIKALINEPVKGVYASSPDMEGGLTQVLKYEYTETGRGRYTVCDLPELINWSVIYIITDSTI